MSDTARQEAERRRARSGITSSIDALLRREFVAGATWQAGRPIVVTVEQVEAAVRELIVINGDDPDEHGLSEGDVECIRGDVRAVLAAALNITVEVSE